jgi:iron(III) transport system substrate-binding protein
VLTKEVGEMNTKISNRYSTRADVAPPEGMPSLKDVKLVNYNRDWALTNRDRLVQQFSKMIGQ